MNRRDDLERSIEGMNVPTGAETDEWILNDAFAALEESKQLVLAEIERGLWQKVKARRTARLIAAAVIIVAVFVGIYMFIGLGEERGRETGKEAEETRFQASREDAAGPEGKLAAELKQIERMFGAGDTRGLVGMLEEGQFASKILSAYYLAKVGDLRAVEALEKLRAEYGENDSNNPFGLAVEIIKNRLKTEGDVAKPGTGVGKEVIAAGSERALDLLIVDKHTGWPMAGVKLDIRIQREGPDEEREDVTDEQGRYRIRIGEKQPDYLRIEARAEGFVPVNITYRKDDGRIDIPRNYTLALEPGTSIGGTVQDEEGQAIEGASVYLLVPSEDDIERVAIWEHEEKTGATGFWQCDIMPSKLDEVWVRLAHPDYVDDETYGATVRASIQELRSITHVAVMKKGLVLTGKVIDANGQPIEGGSVAQGSDRFGSHYPSTRTDAAGRFEFKNAKPGEIVLTVQAKGYGPDLKNIVVGESMSPVEFRLGPGHIVRGRIVDSEDRPIGGAFVAVDTWRGHRSVDWRVDTNAEGRFEWTDAPADEVLFDMGKQGYMSVRNFAMTASEDEYVIVMYRPFKVSGKVTDAETGEPINKFELIPGLSSGEPGRTFWQRRNTKGFTDGLYDLTFNEPRDGYLIRIEAEGYLPAASPVFTDDEDEVVFDFELERGEGPSGVVYLPNGEPAAGAEVVVCTASQTASIQNGEIVQKRDREVVETGADGRFSFPPQAEAYLLAVVGDEGYAEITDIDFEATGRIMLEPWGRVEGVLRVGSKPGVNEAIALYYEKPPEPNVPRVSHHYRAETDVNGHFAFDKLPPGEATVAREIRLGTYRSTYSHSERVGVRPGETVSVTIGGKGRPVVGRVVAPADYNEPVNWANGYGSLHLKLPEPSRPESFDEMTNEEKAAWYKAWRESEEGRAYEKMEREKRRSYGVKVEHDGRFRAEDVPAGTYNLRMSVYEGAKERWGGREEIAGSLNYEFEVPDMNDGRSDEPLDIGTLEIEMVKRLKVGDSVPLFEAESFDGGQIRLADYRGKFVLLSFWMTEHPECVKEMQNLKEIYNTFGKSDRFVMVSLSLDNDMNVADKFTKDNELRWVHGFLGGWSKALVAKEYGVQRLPSTFLIGPDGKMIAKNPTTDQLESVLQKALGM